MRRLLRFCKEKMIDCIVCGYVIRVKSDVKKVKCPACGKINDVK